MKKGKLIIIDGIDGAGKSVQAKLLFQKIKNQKRKVILTSEPRNSKLIKLIKHNQEPITDLFLFLADRSLHYQKIINWLNQGFIVISDRSFPSTLAYQYYATYLKKELQEKVILYLDYFSRFCLSPDIIFILDIKPEIALKRLKFKKKKSEIEKFEKIKFLRKVRKGFLYFAKKFNWKIIDASKNVEEVHLLIDKEVQNKIGLL